MSLPVHSGADIHLADAFASDGCPLCRERDRTEAAYLESVLSESVNDIGFRQGLDQARGFCPAHSRAILRADRRRSGSLGAAILLRATLSVRLRELEAVHRSGGRTRSKRIEAVARPPACPACVRLAVTEAALVDSLMRLVEEAPWADAAAGGQFCLDHLLALLSHRPAPSTWPSIESRQLERLGGIRDDLEAYAHASSHDRRHLITDVHRASVDAAADLLAGPVPAPGSAGQQRRP